MKSILFLGSFALNFLGFSIQASDLKSTVNFTYETKCLKAFIPTGLSQNLWILPGNNSGKRGFYILTSNALNFYALSDQRNCVDKTYKYDFDFYNFKVQLSDNPISYLSYGDPLVKENTPKIAVESKLSDKVPTCILKDKSVIDVESKMAVREKIKEHISNLKKQFDHQTSLAKADNGVSVKFPEQASFVEKLNACDEIKDEDIRQTISKERNLFVRRDVLMGQKQPAARKSKINPALVTK